MRGFELVRGHPDVEPLRVSFLKLSSDLASDLGQVETTVLFSSYLILLLQLATSHPNYQFSYISSLVSSHMMIDLKIWSYFNVDEQRLKSGNLTVNRSQKMYANFASSQQI